MHVHHSATCPKLGQALVILRVMLTACMPDQLHVTDNAVQLVAWCLPAHFCDMVFRCGMCLSVACVAVGLVCRLQRWLPWNVVGLELLADMLLMALSSPNGTNRCHNLAGAFGPASSTSCVTLPGGALHRLALHSLCVYSVLRLVAELCMM